MSGEREEWVPVADAGLGPGDVVADDDHDVVVWRTASGVPCVMDSRCPHQWSHLAAEGVVDGEELVCAAHFWRFDTDGGATKAAMSGRRDPKAPIEVFPCREEDGRIWARLRRPGPALVALAVVLAVLWAPARPAAAQDAEQIRSFTSDVEAAADGSARITEEIVYDFGDGARRGIFRTIPVRFPTDLEGPDPDADYERVTPLVDLRVSSPSGAPADVETTDEDGNLVIRIGDPDRTVTGRQTYVISYRLRGVVNAFDDHDELYLDITGNGWDVPIAEARATVTGPAAPTEAACFRGPRGATLPCVTAAVDGGAGRFGAAGLGPGEGMTAVTAFPPGTFDAEPILDEVWSLARAFEPSPLAIGGGAGLLVVGLGALAVLVWREGRDRRFVAGGSEAAFATGGDHEPVPLGDRPIDPVEFVPPEGIRPGLMGTLWDEVANPLDVSAMIVDLAVRGHLRIEEVEPPRDGVLGLGRSAGDYRFVRTEPPPGGAALSRSEEMLLGALFRDDAHPLLSELRTKFASRLELVQGALYDEAVAAGWFPTRPDRVRARWRGIGIGVTVVGVGVVALAAWQTHLGLLALPVPLVGLAIVALEDRFPRRTARGTAVLGRVRGFRELFAAGEGERQAFLERRQVFSEYLPYAIVFGMAEQWAATFEALGATPEEMGVNTWYVSPLGYHPLAFGYAMRSFTTAATGSIAAAAPSSSASSGRSGFGGGGFSGGGFGGGGGGSW